MKAFRLLPLLIFALALTGCKVQMQRTNVLTQAEVAKLTLANNQIAQSVRGAGVQRALQCIKSGSAAARKQCSQNYIVGLQTDLAKPAEAYAHAANSVRGKCSDDLGKVADGVKQVNIALGQLGQAIQSSSPQGLIAAAKNLQLAWGGVPGVGSVAKSCALRS